MTLGKLVKIVFALLIVFAVAVGLTSINHPIFLKWVTGSARHHGQPISAQVYTNGQLNENVKVFYTDEANNYFVSLPEYDSLGTLKFFNIDLNQKSIGRPVAISNNDYDVIAGHLFQSKAAGNFAPLQDDRKGSSFDPRLTFTSGQIKFNMPPGSVNFDSVRIILP